MNDQNQVTSPAGASEAAFDIAGRAMAAGSGLDWWTKAWPLFTRQIGMWIGVFVVAIIVFAVATLIPVIGQIAVMLLWPVVAGGLMLGAREVDRDGALSFGHLTAGFSAGVGQLILVGVIYLVAMIFAVFIAALVGGVGMGSMVGMGAAGGGDPAAMGAAGATGILLAMLIALALLLPVYMATWFAPALIVFHGVGAVAAMKASFFGCLKNIVPFIVYGLIGMLLAIVASIPFGLGWLVLGPVAVASVYVAYRDIYLGA